MIMRGFNGFALCMDVYRHYFDWIGCQKGIAVHGRIYKLTQWDSQDFNAPDQLRDEAGILSKF